VNGAQGLQEQCTVDTGPRHFTAFADSPKERADGQSRTERILRIVSSPIATLSAKSIQ
jgi:hypothetical protein